MPQVIVNNIKVKVASGTTVLQACEMVGVEIPRFCYHERLAIAGNCRMCLVEVEKVSKPVASCAQPVADGMVVHTNTPFVKKAREGVIEFLLINHPLDCPICDQGGECDLQDQAMKYGKSGSRYLEAKRAVKDKYMGPLIETHMTRCIHCTRCVRFLEDVAGTVDLGAVGRGEKMEITTYIGKSIKSELSGNIIDLCPVGALTSKPYAFKARSWELHSTESIDVLDAVGSNIRIDSIGKEVMRILPRLNEEVNEEWISDKTRFSYDGLKYQRLDTPMIKDERGKFQLVTWRVALQAISNKIKTAEARKIGAIAGDLTDVETMVVMKELLQKLGSNNYDCRQDGGLLDNKFRDLYIFNTTIAGIEKADACLIVGSNPRHEATVLNARLRKAHACNKMQVALIGEEVDLTYPYKYLGASSWILKQIAENEHPYCKVLKEAKNSMIILGASVFVRPDYEAFIYYVQKILHQYNMIREGWNGFNVLQRVASRVGGLDVGFIPEKSGLPTMEMLGNMEVLFLLGADEVDLTLIPEQTFVIYQGHHGDRSAYRADVVLPGAAYTEKDATYVNLEGRVQHTYLAVHPPRLAKSDWVGLAELAQYLGYELGYQNIQQVRGRMAQISAVFSSISSLEPTASLVLGRRRRDFTLDSLQNPIKNFFATDSISRHSRTMLSCAEAALLK